MKYYQFVQQHIHSCPGANMKEKMKACGALWRKQRDGKGIVPPGAHVSNTPHPGAPPMAVVGGTALPASNRLKAALANAGGNWATRLPAINQNLARVHQEDDAHYQNGMRRPPTPRDEMKLPEIRRPGPSSRAIGRGVKNAQMMAAMSGDYASPKPNDTHPKRRRSTKVAPHTGPMPKSRKRNQIVPGSGLFAPGHRKGGKTGILEQVLGSLIGKGLGGRGKRGGEAKGALSALLHGLTIKVL